MIKLSRNTPSAGLAAAVGARITRLVAHIHAGTEPPAALLDAYRDPDVKRHLTAETHGKCAYCESKVTHVYFGDVEHIRPKAVFPLERLNLENLTLVCAICNNAKSNYWDATLPVIDPFQEDPDEKLMVVGFLLARKPGDDQARITIEKLKLNRSALLERRRERVELLMPLADQYALAPNGPLKDLLRDELRRQANGDGEYAMVVRAYLLAACGLSFP